MPVTCVTGSAAVPSGNCSERHEGCMPSFVDEAVALLSLEKVIVALVLLLLLLLRPAFGVFVRVMRTFVAFVGVGVGVGGVRLLLVPGVG